MLKLHAEHAIEDARSHDRLTIPTTPRTVRREKLVRALDNCPGMRKVNRLMASARKSLALARSLREDLEADPFTGTRTADGWALDSYLREFTTLNLHRDLAAFEVLLENLISITGSELDAAN